MKTMALFMLMMIGSVNLSWAADSGPVTCVKAALKEWKDNRHSSSAPDDHYSLCVGAGGAGPVACVKAALKEFQGTPSYSPNPAEYYPLCVGATGIEPVTCVKAALQEFGRYLPVARWHFPLCIEKR